MDPFKERMFNSSKHVPAPMFLRLQPLNSKLHYLFLNTVQFQVYEIRKALNSVFIYILQGDSVSVYNSILSLKSLQLILNS